MGLQSVETELVDTLVDGGRPLPERLSVARKLAEHDSAVAVRALISVAQCAEAPAELRSTVGRSLGRICFRRRQDLDDLVVAEMTGEAYLGYDAELAQLLRRSPHVHLKRGSIGPRLP